MDSTETLNMDESQAEVNEVMSEASPSKTAKKGLTGIRYYITVEPVAFLFLMANMPTATLIQQYVYKEIGKEYNLTSVHNSSGNGSESVCHANASDPDASIEHHVQTLASNWMVGFSLIFMVPAFFSTIQLGGFSNYIGRKPAMVLPLVGLLVKIILCIVIIHYSFSIYFFYVIAFLEGVSGGIATMIMAVFSYIADISDKKQRAVRVFVLEIMVGIGVSTAQVSVGHMIQALGFVYPFILVGAFALINLLIVLFYVIETVDKKPDSHLLSSEHFKKALNLLFKDDGSHRRWKIQMSLCILLVVCFVDLGGMEVQTLYMLESPLCFNSIMIGYFIAAIWLLKTLASTVFMKILYLKVGDTGSILIGCISGTCAQIVLALAYKQWILFIAPLVGMFAYLVVPLVRAFISKLVSGAEQGTAFAMIAMSQQLFVLVGSSSITSLYGHTLTYVHGFIFYLTAAIYSLAIFITGAMIFQIRKESPGSKQLAHIENPPDVTVPAHDDSLIDVNNGDHSDSQPDDQPLLEDA